MIVKELIEQLLTCDEDADVVVSITDTNTAFDISLIADGDDEVLIIV